MKFEQNIIENLQKRWNVDIVLLNSYHHLFQINLVLFYDDQQRDARDYAANPKRLFYYFFEE